MSNKPQTVEAVIERLARAQELPNSNLLSLMEAIGLDPIQDFRGGKWRGQNFSMLNLTAFNFRGADLRQARFDDSNICDASFEGAQISPAKIRKAKNWRLAHFDDGQWVMLVRQSLAAQPIGERLAEIDAIEASNCPLREKEWVALIKAAEPNYFEASAILKQMDLRGEPPSRYAYATVIAMARTYEDAKNDFDNFIEKGGQQDAVLYAALIDRMTNVEEAIALLDRMIELKFDPGEHAFNSALKIAVRVAREDRKQLMHFVNELQQRGMKFGPIGFNILIGASRTASDAIAILERMLSEGSRLRPHDINQALRALEGAEIVPIIEFARNHGIDFDDISYNLIIREQQSALSAIPWLDRRIKAGFQPDLHTLKSMLYCAESALDAAIGLTILQRRGFDIYRRESVEGIAEKARNYRIRKWVTMLWEDMIPPREAMRLLFHSIFSGVPRESTIWMLID